MDPASIAPEQSLGYEQKPNFYACGSTKPLELDSLDLIQLGMMIDEEFGIDTTDDELDDQALNHVGGLVAYVQGKVDAKFAAVIDQLDKACQPPIVINATAVASASATRRHAFMTPPPTGTAANDVLDLTPAMQISSSGVISTKEA